MPSIQNLKKVFYDKGKAKINISRADGLYDFSPITDSQIEAVRYVQARAYNNDKIFVANPNHDKTIYNDVMFYFFQIVLPQASIINLSPALQILKKYSKNNR